MRNIFTALMFVFLSVIFFGCEQLPNNQGETPTDTTYTFADFYEQLTMYEERIEDIIYEWDPVQEMSTSAAMMSSNMSEEDTVTIRRDDILAVHNAATFDKVNDDYMEQLMDTQLFVSDLKELLADYSDIGLNEDFHPEDEEDITYQFIMSNTDYILIDVLTYGIHSYLKLGLDNDLLSYQEFVYYYAGISVDPRDAVSMNFSYFKFLENKEAVYINYSDAYASLRYTSIEHDEQFTISGGIGVIEGSNYEEIGYVLNRYDRETNSQAYLQVVDDQIVGETYDVFDEHGSVYRYDDYDFNDDQKRLQVNFITATGWDYVVASDGSNPEIDELTGIFKDDGTKLYDAFFNHTFTDRYAHLGLWIDLNETPLSDDVFSLSQFDMNLNHPKANMAFFSQVRLDSFEEMKDALHIENLDFFAEDLRDELYLYVDEDIRNDLEGIKEPIITTGDVEAFDDALMTFMVNLDETPQYVSQDLATTTIKDGSNVISTSSTQIIDIFDLNNLFFKRQTLISAPGVYGNYQYVIDGSTGALLSFDINQSLAYYTLLSDVANETTFMDAYESLVGDDGLEGIIQVTQVSDLKFELLVDGSYLREDGISMAALLEQQGISGLNDIEITITYEFLENYTGYNMTFSIIGLSFQDYAVEIETTSEVAITTIDYTRPLENTSYYFNLAPSVDDIIFTSGESESTWHLDNGLNYMRLYLNEGEYGISIYGPFSQPSFKVYDQDMNELIYDQRFEATYSGVYYIEINNEYPQIATIMIWNSPSPVYYEYELEPTANTFEEFVEITNTVGLIYIDIPVFDEDRILIFDPYVSEVMSVDDRISFVARNDEIHFSEHFYFTSYDMNSSGKQYMYIPKNTALRVDLYGHYEGIFGFDYHYITIPTGAYDNVTDLENYFDSPILFMTEQSPISRVNFTITEAGNYTLDTYYKDMGYSYQDAELYNDSDEQIDYDWDSSRYLEPGDYHILYTQGYTEELYVMVIPSITKD